jgi:integrase
MANIQERKSKDGKVTYRVQVRLKGYPSQTASFSRKTDAKRWAQQIESAIREGRHFKTAESKKRTLAELIDRYIEQVLPTKPKSYKKQKSQLLWWRDKLGAYALADITPAKIAECRDFLLSESTSRGDKRSNSTVVRYLAALSHAFSIAVREWQWIEDSPVRKITKPKESRGRLRFLSDEERQLLLNECKQSKNSHLYHIVLIALATGMRRGEILNLKWSDIDLEKDRIVLHETKNGEKRVVPVTPLLKEIFNRILEHSQKIDTFVFSNKHGNGPVDIRTAWQEALERTQISDFRFHDLRHSCAERLITSGATLSEISEVLGHKTLSMVKRYSHMSETHAAKILTRMNEQII